MKLATLLVLLSGCVRVAPWQREVLARPALRDPPWSLQRRIDQHVFEVRESSRGGYGSAGGGCGCN